MSSEILDIAKMYRYLVLMHGKFNMYFSAYTIWLIRKFENTDYKKLMQNLVVAKMPSSRSFIIK